MGGGGHHPLAQLPTQPAQLSSVSVHPLAPPQHWLDHIQGNTEHHLPVDHAGQCRQHGGLVSHASHGSQVLPSLLPHVQGAGHLGCGWPLPGKTSPIKRGL